jgi:pantetheine-phosphate adenylyltransferase
MAPAVGRDWPKPRCAETMSVRDDEPMVVTAVITGSFDPLTLGHLDLIRRAYQIFGRLIVGIGVNPDKPSLWTPQERVELIRKCIPSDWSVQVEHFEGLTVDFVRRHAAQVIVRGIRSSSDLEYELAMARTNRQLAPEIETVFLPSSVHCEHLSATLIRQLARWGSAEQLKQFVPEPVIGPLMERVRGVSS